MPYSLPFLLQVGPYYPKAERSPLTDQAQAKGRAFLQPLLLHVWLFCNGPCQRGLKANTYTGCALHPVFELRERKS